MTPEEIAAEIVKKSRESLASESKCGCEGRRAYCAYHYGMEDGHESLLAALREAGYRIVKQERVSLGYSHVDDTIQVWTDEAVVPYMAALPLWRDVEVDAPVEDR